MNIFKRIFTTYRNTPRTNVQVKETQSNKKDEFKTYNSKITLESKKI